MMCTMSTSARPSSYHHGNLRAELVRAGLAQLATQSHADISLRELAREVGVSANAVYRHFANKEALLAAMAAEGFRQLAVAQQQAAGQHTHPVEMFLHSGRAYVAFARQHPALYRLMFGHFTVGSHSEEMKEARELAYAGLRDGVALALRLDAGTEAVTVPALHAWSLVHGLSQLILDGQLETQGTEDAVVNAVLLQAALFGRQLAAWDAPAR